MMSGNSKMSHCVVPNWNNIIPRHQRQEEHVDDDREENITSHHHVQSQNQTRSIINKSNSTSNNTSCNQQKQVKELTWDNGQIAMHGHGLIIPSGPSKPVWARTNGTLESLVHQGTSHNKSVTWTPASTTISSDIAGSSAGKWADNNPPHWPTSETRKRARCDSDQGGAKNFSRGNSMQIMQGEGQGGPSGSGTHCRESDTTMVTWASFESPHTHNNEGSASHGCLDNKDEDCNTKGESGRSNNSSRRSRAAAVHNQSERRRRDRINQKMKALQKLVPNASKTDKASMLDEVIEYLKQLQSQLQLMNTVRNMTAAAAPQPQPPPPHVMMMMHHHQLMSLLAARMGMGMGMFDMTSLPRGPHQPLIAAAAVGPTHPFVPPPHPHPHPHLMMPAAKPAGSPPPPPPTPPGLPDPYWALLAQSMNMELYNKMAVLYSQQQQTTSAQAAASNSPSRSHQTSTL